jgi:hypothetical protein
MGGGQEAGVSDGDREKWWFVFLEMRTAQLLRRDAPAQTRLVLF